MTIHYQQRYSHHPRMIHEIINSDSLLITLFTARHRLVKIWNPMVCPRQHIVILGLRLIHLSFIYSRYHPHLHETSYLCCDDVFLLDLTPTSRYLLRFPSLLLRPLGIPTLRFVPSLFRLSLSVLIVWLADYLV